MRNVANRLALPTNCRPTSRHGIARDAARRQPLGRDAPAQPTSTYTELIRRRRASPTVPTTPTRASPRTRAAGARSQLDPVRVNSMVLASENWPKSPDARMATVRLWRPGEKSAARSFHSTRSDPVATGLSHRGGRQSTNNSRSTVCQAFVPPDRTTTVLSLPIASPASRPSI